MNNIQIVPFEPKHQHWSMYRAMVGLGLLCTVIIVSVYQGTFPVIRENKIELIQQSVYAMYPEESVVLYFEYDPKKQAFNVSQNLDRAMIYGVYDNSHSLLGFAIKARGMGYQDAIELLYAYAPEQQIIKGFKVVESRETPGLGSKIETDPAFQQNFAKLPVRLNVSGNKLEHGIEAVKKGRKQHPWQVDTISGATISSTAVTTIISTSAAHWVPLLIKQKERFQFVSNNP